MIIAVDFDGTCVKHRFPGIGQNIGAEDVLRDLVAAGHKLVLFTVRSDKAEVDIQGDSTGDIHSEPGDYLTQAVMWFALHGIELWGIQSNPEQAAWSTSPKPYAHLLIDDSALGCPVAEQGGEKWVDWEKVRRLLEADGIL